MRRSASPRPSRSWRRGLLEIRDEIRADPELSERIRRKFEIKNTIGYRLVAFLDARHAARDLPAPRGRLGGHARVRRRGGVRHRAARPRTSTTGAAALPRHRRRLRAVPALVELGRARRRADGRADAATRARLPGHVPRRARELGRAALRGRGAAGRAGRRRRRRSWPSAKRAALELLAAHALLEPAEFTRDRELTELYWKIREGMFGIVGTLRPHGTLLITEDVCVPPARVAEAAKDIQALLGKHALPHRRGRPRVGGQPALHAHAGHEQARGPRALRGLHGRADGADRGQVRRLAEGRARHRPQHGSLRRARVGREGDGDDVADQAARRPAWRARAGRGPQPRPRRAHARPEADAADRARRRRRASSAASAIRCARAAGSPRLRASGS